MLLNIIMKAIVGQYIIYLYYKYIINEIIFNYVVRILIKSHESTFLMPKLA